MTDKTPEEKFLAALAEHVGCVKPYCFIRRADKVLLAPQSFDMEYNRVVNQIEGIGTGKGAKYMDRAAKYAIASPALEVVRDVCYEPDGLPIIGRKFNMWTDPGVKPLKGIPKIFLEHIDYLIPNPAERKLLLQWLAWIVQHPDEKVQFAILIVGRGGTGKSWLGTLMERIFGEDNVVLISEDNMVTGIFNSFSQNKRFVFLHETPPDEIEKLLHKVKGLITQEHIHIRLMRQDYFKVRNIANLMTISNDDVKIDLSNRRWGVLRAADDPYAPNGTAEHAAYYKRLFAVVPKDGTITDEARRVLHYLRTLPLEGFNPLVAPLTGAKQEAAESGDDGLVRARITNAYAAKEGPFRFNLLTAEDVAKHVGYSANKTLTEIMQDVGCRKLRRKDGRDVQVSLNGARPRLWAINPKVAAQHINTDTDELVRLYLEERKGKPTVAPMPTPDYDDDIANDPMFAPGGDDDSATVH